LRDKGITITRGRKLKIKRVFYFGDKDGIMCDLAPAENAWEPFVRESKGGSE
jgi:hypothetical protein